MAVFNNELYVVGYFTEAGGIPADNIAKWDGTEWCGLGSTFYNGVNYSAEKMLPLITRISKILYVSGNKTPC